jgi:hypothetical protein
LDLSHYYTTTAFLNQPFRHGLAFYLMLRRIGILLVPFPVRQQLKLLIPRLRRRLEARVTVSEARHPVWLNQQIMPRNWPKVKFHYRSTKLFPNLAAKI